MKLCLPANRGQNVSTGLSGLMKKFYTLPPRVLLQCFLCLLFATHADLTPTICAAINLHPHADMQLQPPPSLTSFPHGPTSPQASLEPSREHLSSRMDASVPRIACPGCKCWIRRRTGKSLIRDTQSLLLLRSFPLSYSLASLLYGVKSGIIECVHNKTLAKR